VAAAIVDQATGGRQCQHPAGGQPRLQSLADPVCGHRRCDLADPGRVPVLPEAAGSWHADRGG